MEEVFLNTVQDFNDYQGVETLHPLVSVVHVENTSHIKACVMHYGVYAIYLKENKGCKLSYGRTPYDFDEMTVTAFSPGQVVKVEPNPDVPFAKFTALVFHPDLLTYLIVAADAGSEQGSQIKPLFLADFLRQLASKRFGSGSKACIAHCLEVFAVYPVQLVVVKYCRGFAEAVQIELGNQLIHGEDFLLGFRAPAQQSHIVGNCLRQIAHVYQLAEACGTVALGQLGNGSVLVFAHNRRQMDESRRLPAQELALLSGLGIQRCCGCGVYWQQ